MKVIKQIASRIRPIIVRMFKIFLLKDSEGSFKYSTFSSPHSKHEGLAVPVIPEREL